MREPAIRALALEYSGGKPPTEAHLGAARDTLDDFLASAAVLKGDNVPPKLLGDISSRFDDAPWEVKAYLGVNLDPEYLAQKAIGSVVHQNQLLTTLKKVCMNEKLASVQPVNGWAKIDEKRAGPLNGLYVRPDVEREILGLRKALPEWMQTVKNVVNTSKLLKVPLSFGTLSANMMSNLAFMWIGGMDSVKIPHYMKWANAIRTKGLDGSLNRSYDKMVFDNAVNRGLLGKGFMTSDADMAFDDLGRQVSARQGGAALKASIGARKVVENLGGRRMGNMYSAAEEICKLAFFRHALEKEGVTLENLGSFAKSNKLKAAADRAAEKTNGILLDYEEVPGYLKIMRNTFWPFASFYVLMGRNLLGGKLGSPARILAVMGALGGIQAMLNDTETGQGIAQNVRWDPSNIIPFFAPMAGTAPGGRSLLQEVATPLVPGGVLRIPYDLAQGRDRYDRPIDDGLAYTVKQLLPSWTYKVPQELAEGNTLGALATLSGSPIRPVE